MNRYIKRIAQFIVPKKSNLYKYLRGIYLFNDLNSPRPLLVKESIDIKWHKVIPELDIPDIQKIVYLISPIQRSGTNYLYQLLQFHPQISIPLNKYCPPEHYLLSYSNSLKEYVLNTTSIWNYWIRGNEFLDYNAHRMMAFIGYGMFEFFQKDKDKILLLKTPDSNGINSFFHLFPQGKIIILIRDGRDTIESFMKSWGGRGIFKSLAKRWNDRVIKINQFIKYSKENKLDHLVHILDYNQLNQNSKEEINKILSFLELDNSHYDYDAMKNAPVLGSSMLRGSKEKVNWDPISKPENFNLKPKWSNWTNREKKIFKKYAGKSLIDLGYESDSNW